MKLEDSNAFTSTSMLAEGEGCAFAKQNANDVVSAIQIAIDATRRLLS